MSSALTSRVPATIARSFTAASQRGTAQKPQSGTTRTRSAGASQGDPKSLRDRALGSHVERLHVHEAHADVLDFGDLREQVDLAQLAIGELEHQLVRVRVEDRGEQGRIGALEAWPAGEVAEADVQPDSRVTPSTAWLKS